VALCCLALFVAVPIGVTRARPAAAAEGIYTYPMNGAAFGVRAPIHLVTFYGAPYSLEVGLAHNKVDGGLETPSAICRATAGCVAAVNGDYFDVPNSKKPDPGDEVGGIVSGCVLEHTPEVSHQQANLDDGTVSTQFTWNASVSVSGTSVTINAINQELPMSYVGVSDPLRGTLLFTSAYALPTPTASGRFTYQFKEVSTVQSPTTINSTAQLQYIGRTPAAIHVLAGRVDISASNSTTLAGLVAGDIVTLTTNSTMGCDDIGGHPIILNDGVTGTVGPSDSYMKEPFPRTIVGWTSMGETVVLTVGGTDGRSGATWNQLLAIFRALNVVTALDLDGGSSTSMYANGRSIYSARASERPVSTALLVIEAPTSTATTTTTTTTTTTLP
jgi:hypothetical protein